MLDRLRSGDRDGSWSMISGEEPGPQLRLATRAQCAPEKVTFRPGLDVVQEYVTGNFHRQLPVSQLAKIAGLSCGYFSRVFRISTGNSPHAFVVACRLKHALNLLKSPDMKLIEIALECGFSDQAHFCRLFRKSTGWTPTAWRRHFGKVDHGSN